MNLKEWCLKWHQGRQKYDIIVWPSRYYDTVIIYSILCYRFCRTSLKAFLSEPLLDVINIRTLNDDLIVNRIYGDKVLGSIWE